LYSLRHYIWRVVGSTEGTTFPNAHHNLSFSYLGRVYGKINEVWEIGPRLNLQLMRVEQDVPKVKGAGPILYRLPYEGTSKNQTDETDTNEKFRKIKKYGARRSGLVYKDRAALENAFREGVSILETIRGEPANGNNQQMIPEETKKFGKETQSGDEHATEIHNSKSKSGAISKLKFSESLKRMTLSKKRGTHDKM